MLKDCTANQVDNWRLKALARIGIFPSPASSASTVAVEEIMEHPIESAVITVCNTFPTAEHPFLQFINKVPLEIPPADHPKIDTILGHFFQFIRSLQPEGLPEITTTEECPEMETGHIPFAAHFKEKDPDLYVIGQAFKHLIADRNSFSADFFNDANNVFQTLIQEKWKLLKAPATANKICKPPM